MTTKTLPTVLLLATVALAACNPAGPQASPSRPPTTPGSTPGSSPGATPSPLAPTPTPPTPAPPSGPPATGQAALDGRDFLSVDVNVGGEPLQLVRDTRIRIGFHDGQISASAGCNHFGGQYRIDGERIIVDGGSMTEMGCDRPRHAQDEWLFGFLGAGPTFSLAGNDLILTATDTTITLLDAEAAQPDQPLTDRTWTLTSIINGDSVSSIPAEIIATLVFNADGSVDVHPGCNSGGGTYTDDGTSITFGDIVLTRMACMGGPGQVEEAVLAVLSAGTVTYVIDASTLTLTTGDLGLQFTTV